MKKLLAITMMLLMSSLTMSAQINDLTEQDIQAFRDRIGEVIDMFQNNLSILGSKKRSDKVKAVYKKSALKLFMGEGLPFKDLNTGEERKGVMMQVTTVKKGNTEIQNKLLIDYLDALVKLPYAEVKMTKSDTYRISNIYKVGDHYEATATIFQRFEGYIGKEMKKKYVDVTQKNIKVYIVPENDYVLGQHWSVRLGDIEAVETTN